MGTAAAAGAPGYEKPIREAAGRDSHALNTARLSLAVGFHEERLGSSLGPDVDRARR
jgi:hypothetical protein